jgi:hypothetical protein
MTARGTGYLEASSRIIQAIIAEHASREIPPYIRLLSLEIIQ